METANGLVIWWILLHHCFWSCISTDTITIDKPIRDGELLVSKEQKFALGFFSPGKSTNRYVGIWYNNLPEQTVVWVANRDQPINDTSGILSINHEGNLVLHHSYSTFPIWSTNVTLTLSNTTVIAQLSDIANLVLIQNNTKTIIWQSFDHLTDTILPYSKMGFDRRTHQRWFLQSWKSDDDPGSGTFTHNFTSSGKAQVFLFKQNHKWWRGGSFNGEIFVGIPFMKRAMITTFNYTIVDDDDEVYFMFNTFDDSIIARLMVHQSGFLQLFTWDSQKIQWKRYWSAPETECDNYGTCGFNSNCNPLNYEDFQCSCLPGFEPRNPNDWYQNRDASGGCIRKNEKSICGNGEGFVKVEGVKIPDTSIAIEEKGLSLEECEKECLKNCSCMAYAAANVRNGGSGCLAWYGTLMDTQKLSDGGHDLYIRVDSIELENYARKSGGILTKKGLMAIPIASFAAITIFIAFYVFKRKREDRMRYLNQDSPSEEEHGQSRTHIKLPFFGIKTVVAATNNFASENELGQGGFGFVYKGQLIDGQEIAVKRLSKGSGQGTQEFKNEVKLIAKLQHRNLVRLLGCCIHKKERMLIYEYLPNKSLDFFIFDITQKSSLLWDKRFEIILGIARGILYLHQDSRLKIIHRDLKASNILLDAAMNPKISDFGMARIFREDQIQAITRRIVGTYGYMAPEYAMEGEYSTKSDVFSFGVLLLEIISGKRNTDRKQRGRASLNLIGHVWNLHRERRATDIVDSTLGQSFPASIVLRCIIIGLLCVQESPMNRPSMLQVVFMLGNETTLPSPKKPAFLFNGNEDHPESSGSSVNEVTFTTISAR